MLARNAGNVLGCGGQLFQEAQYLVSPDVRVSLPRRRGTGGEDRAIVPESGARAGRSWSEYHAVWDDLRHVRHGSIYCGEHPRWVFCCMAGPEASTAAADPSDEPTDAHLFLSQHGIAHQYGVGHTGHVAGDVWIWFRICGSNAADDAGDCSGKIPDRALCICELADELREIGRASCRERV